MSKKARTPILEYDDSLAIELPGDRAPQERDRLTDQAMVVAYDRLPRRQPRWRLRALYFDREEWTRSGIRRWWAAHEVWFLAEDQFERPVPEICRFYGIIIRMFVEQNAPHHRPHFHAYYQNRSAVYGLDPIELISGELSPRERRLVEAWAELHSGGLIENWSRIKTGETVLKITPLK